MSKKLEERLTLIKDIKRFAVEEAGIIANDSFTTTNLELKTIYCFFAAPKKGEIKATRENYESFYDSNELVRYSTKFSKKKYDKYVRKVEAIGSEDVPITPGLINADTHRLIYIMNHENIHIHFELNNIKINKNLEEPICDYIAFDTAKQYTKKYAPKYTRAIQQYQNKIFRHHQLFNDIITTYNQTCPETILPDTKIFKNIKTLEKIFEKSIDAILREDNSINKAILQDAYVYSKEAINVVNILQNTTGQDCLKKIVSYDKPINTLDDLREAIIQ